MADDAAMGDEAAAAVATREQAAAPGSQSTSPALSPRRLRRSPATQRCPRYPRAPPHRAVAGEGGREA